MIPCIRVLKALILLHYSLMNYPFTSTPSQLSSHFDSNISWCLNDKLGLAFSYNNKDTSKTKRKMHKSHLKNKTVITLKKMLSS